MLILLITLCLPAAYAKEFKIPDYIHTCSQRDPQYKKCIKDAVRIVMPHVINGMREFRTPSLNPLYIPKMEVWQDGGLVELSAVSKEYRVHGLDNFKVAYMRADPVNLKFYLNLYFPFLNGSSLYKAQGKVLFLDVEGEGNVEAQATDVYFLTSFRGKLERRDDEDYVKIEKATCDFQESSFKIRVGSIVGNHGTWDEDLVNAFVNSNIKYLIPQYQWVLSEAYSALFMDMANKVFSKIPYSQIFPK